MKRRIIPACSRRLRWCIPMPGVRDRQHPGASTNCCNLLRRATVLPIKEVPFQLTRTIKAGGCMKKFIATLMIGGLLSAAAVSPALAQEWDHPHIRGGVFNPLWPVVAALSIPAAVAGAIANVTVPAPAELALPPLPPAPRVYSAPPAYNAPRVYVTPAPRSDYYAPREYYQRDHYRPHHHHNW